MANKIDRQLAVHFVYDGKKADIKIAYPVKGQEGDPIADMQLLCEALCTVIHGAHNAKVKPDYESLKSCVRHLEMGVIDDPHYKSTYTGIKH